MPNTYYDPHPRSHGSFNTDNSLKHSRTNYESSNGKSISYRPKYERYPSRSESATPEFLDDMYERPSKRSKVDYASPKGPRSSTLRTAGSGLYCTYCKRKNHTQDECRQKIRHDRALKSEELDDGYDFSKRLHVPSPDRSYDDRSTSRFDKETSEYDEEYDRPYDRSYDRSYDRMYDRRHDDADYRDYDKRFDRDYTDDDREFGAWNENLTRRETYEKGTKGWIELGPEEKESLMANGRCFYCKQRGHISSNCGEKRKDAQAQNSKANSVNAPRPQIEKRAISSSSSISSKALGSVKGSTDLKQANSVNSSKVDLKAKPAPKGPKNDTFNSQKSSLPLDPKSEKTLWADSKSKQQTRKDDTSQSKNSYGNVLQSNSTAQQVKKVPSVKKPSQMKPATNKGESTNIVEISSTQNDKGDPEIDFDEDEEDSVLFDIPDRSQASIVKEKTASTASPDNMNDKNGSRYMEHRGLDENMKEKQICHYCEQQDHIEENCPVKLRGVSGGTREVNRSKINDNSNHLGNSNGNRRPAEGHQTNIGKVGKSQEPSQAIESKESNPNFTIDSDNVHDDWSYGFNPSDATHNVPGGGDFIDAFDSDDQFLIPVILDPTSDGQIALIDTGFTTSFIRLDVIKKLGLQELVESCPPYTFNSQFNDSIVVKQRIRMLLAIGKWSSMVQFAVTNNLSEEIILGLPFVRQNASLINWKDLSYAGVKHYKRE